MSIGQNRAKAMVACVYGDDDEDETNNDEDDEGMEWCVRYQMIMKIEVRSIIT